MMAKCFWIEGSWEGQLAIVPRPRGGDWLDEEVDALLEADIGVVVSLLEEEETKELELDAEKGTCEAKGLRFFSLPIPDRSIPESIREVQDLVATLKGLLAAGSNVAIHCRQGVGRSSLLAACLLVEDGLDVESAFARISEARFCTVPDTVEQREWVEKFQRVPQL